MKTKLLTFFIFLISLNLYAQGKIDVKKQILLATAQYELLLKAHQDTTKIPQSFKRRYVFRVIVELELL